MYQKDADFNFVVEYVLEVEGLFSDHPSDRGGMTKYGITQNTWTNFRRRYWTAVLSEHQNHQSVADLSIEQAKIIYYQMYWCDPKIHLLSDQYVKAECFEAGVNCGQTNGIRFLQRACNFCRYPDWNEIATDGFIGPQTMGAVTRLARTNKTVRNALVLAQNGYQFIYYDMLVQREPERYLNFSRGFMKRLIALME